MRYDSRFDDPGLYWTLMGISTVMAIVGFFLGIWFISLCVLGTVVTNVLDYAWERRKKNHTHGT